MKKIVITSDSHGSANALRRILRKEKDAYAMIFLGDGVTDLEGLKEEFPGLKLYWVCGNCDHIGYGPDEGLTPFDGVLFYFAHGHQHNVRFQLQSIAETAQARGADVALYGHTHIKEDTQLCGVRVFNPGSVGRPRDGQASYGVALCDQGEVQLMHREVPPLWEE